MDITSIPKIGAIMRLKQPIIEGPLKELRFDEAGQIEALVAYMGEDGEAHERFFPIASLEEIEAPHE